MPKLVLRLKLQLGFSSGNDGVYKNPLNILITGVAGFLGRNLIGALHPHRIMGLGTRDETIEGIPVFSVGNLDKISLSPDILIVGHAAVAAGSQHVPNSVLYEVNVALTEKILDTFKDAFVIYISTASVYDNQLPSIEENSAIAPQSAYAVSKLWAEGMVSRRAHATILRFSSLFGNGMKEETLIPRYVNQALRTGEIEVWGRGERWQNYLHVLDACAYVQLAVENPEKVQGRILLAVSQKEHTNEELANLISREIGARIVHKNTDPAKSLRYNNNVTRSLLGIRRESLFEEQIKNYITWKQRQS